MISRDFCFWLQGYFEMSGAKTLTEEQVRMIREHLKLVFRSEQTQISLWPATPSDLEKAGDGLPPPLTVNLLTPKEARRRMMKYSKELDQNAVYMGEIK